MSETSPISEANTYTYTRTFTHADVEAFTKLAGDSGDHHVHPDAEGRLMVHGLLTATLPTKLGGDLNFIAASMTFNFRRPVFTGDTVTVVGRAAHIERTPERTNLVLEFECTNQHGKIVLSGSTHGFAPPDA